MITFRDQDDAFENWRDSHPDGFIVNHHREPEPSYLKLHRATCYHLAGEPQNGRGNNWTSTYAKTCSESLAELRAWARTLGGELDPCGHCAPPG